MGNLLPTRFYSTIGNLKNILHCRCIDLRHPKIIFNFVSLVKNNFRRLPRRAYGTARNDEYGSLKTQIPKPLFNFQNKNQINLLHNTLSNFQAA
ncbi:MAG: hypothetical protein IKI11_04840 [Neisseriaceae bacterium]|nr:hypothetical protein [Neisseriaceae bacterium]